MVWTNRNSPNPHGAPLTVAPRQSRTALARTLRRWMTVAAAVPHGYGPPNAVQATAASFACPERLGWKKSMGFTSLLVNSSVNAAPRS
jgi:hypothetical protein